jgi:hypothetical protein
MAIVPTHLLFEWNVHFTPRYVLKKLHDAHLDIMLHSIIGPCAVPFNYKQYDMHAKLRGCLLRSFRNDLNSGTTDLY